MPHRHVSFDPRSWPRGARSGAEPERDNAVQLRRAAGTDVRIVDPDTSTECAAGTVGEIWVHGDNVAEGYWQKPEETERTFGAQLVAPSAGTPEGPWLRTGDLGVISDGELFIMGRSRTW